MTLGLSPFIAFFNPQRPRATGTQFFDFRHSPGRPALKLQAEYSVGGRLSILRAWQEKGLRLSAQEAAELVGDFGG